MPLNYKLYQAYPTLCWVCIFVLLVGCQKQREAPDNTYVFVKPANFPEPTYTFKNNPVTKEGFLLGRRLFFDPLLSKDGSVSCNNCHIQSTAFADAQQHPLSIGVENRVGIRNAPALANLAFMPEFFWDGGVTHLDFVPINAIEAAFEMDETIENVVKKLNESTVYPALFKKAFGVDKVTSPYMLQALSQFMTMMVSANSRYDKYQRGEGEQLSDDEQAGLTLFQAKCGSCHTGALFTDFSYRNNGISTTFSDEGRARISEATEDIGKFRVPSLRNVALTAPYMHNAKFRTLEEVLKHYAEGVQPSATLDASLQRNGRLGIALTSEEQRKIIVFLRTLTDNDFRSDERFQNRNEE
ncbi:cytochrome c peroxidase [uncultured Microscilla sp.]|uniref:cytochrome-c peroxidase n=1 Tax=uncultured Microscilla sp. TaxID=432653 RepID=UPI002602A89E|nr:cytochrome c peroxidase [uncultured Microscilla sp.]